jgi:hypothetical protein
MKYQLFYSSLTCAEYSTLERSLLQAICLESDVVQQLVNLQICPYSSKWSYNLEITPLHLANFEIDRLIYSFAIKKKVDFR